MNQARIFLNWDEVENMGRIEWSRYSGEDIEHAIAMFIASEDQYAEKISPSRGDGGIDILVRYPRTIVY
ncbi:hypothetical protein [Corynebacterium striatum]|nr:hypothetical protein [Corynebacterium striatum]